MIEVVKEFPTTDGIGAMLWKKIYAMSFAYHHNLLFEDTPFDWFLIHESDRVNNSEEYKFIINQFNTLLHNPWSEINFEEISDKIISNKIGKGLGVTPYGPGFVKETNHLFDSPVFNKILNDNSNNIVIHLRRGNAIPENPRYIEDTFYLNLLSKIDILCSKLNLKNCDVIICTDAPDIPTTFYPNDSISFSKQLNNIHPSGQRWMWHQPHLYTNENGEYPITSANFDEYRKVYPKIKIYNKLSTYDSMLLMLKARLLITSYSAFSQSAGLLSHNKVIGLSDRHGISPLFNIFKNQVGIIDNNGYVML